MRYEFQIKTERQHLYDITRQVEHALHDSGIVDGIAIVFCPHTTAGITINENADPDVIHDILLGLNQAFPDRREYRHAEGNSDAHLKASYVGSSCTIIVEDGKLLLGRWQGIYFCEFDGPRQRRYHVKFISTH